MNMKLHLQGGQKKLKIVTFLKKYFMFQTLINLASIK